MYRVISLSISISLQDVSCKLVLKGLHQNYKDAATYSMTELPRQSNRFSQICSFRYMPVRYEDVPM